MRHICKQESIPVGFVPPTCVCVCLTGGVSGGGCVCPGMCVSGGMCPGEVCVSKRDVQEVCPGGVQVGCAHPQTQRHTGEQNARQV